MLLKRIGVIILNIVVALFGGFVLSKMWGWFVVPQFGLAPLSVVNAVGLKLVAGTIIAPQFFYIATLKERRKHIDDGGTNSGYSAILSIAVVVMYAFALLAAWCWTLVR